jgi:hypothetical protein
MAIKKVSKEKRLGDRRNTERRLRRRRLKKDPPSENRRKPATRRAEDRRGGVRRQGDTYLAKIQEFKAGGKYRTCCLPWKKKSRTVPKPSTVLNRPPTKTRPIPQIRPQNQKIINQSRQDR